MITRKELVTSKEYHLGNTQNKLYEEVKKYLAENDLNQTQFAEMLNVGKSYVSQVLRGNFDHKLSSFFDLSIKIGKIPDIKFVDVETYIQRDTLKYLVSAIEKNIETKVKPDTNENPVYGNRSTGRIIQLDPDFPDDTISEYSPISQAM